ncbi:leukemia inhibitory factor receptor-like isoform X1 [Acipenser ruthenus]|uniref:leukemia inhibitory factor receptor-like isoform X1 n=1 Tax=Acipenser ruthenus TaxID=7906 RepID=UPI002740925A|nr:leukemia inhibitory factor receptor-like isoform X1 [Acipenser ruthenus]
MLPKLHLQTLLTTVLLLALRVDVSEEGELLAESIVLITAGECGYLSVTKPVLSVGSSLTATCHLCKEETASWEYAGSLVSPQLYSQINSTVSTLTLDSLTLTSREGENLTCRSSKGESYSQLIQTGYSPQAPTDLECVTHDMLTFICSWSAGSEINLKTTYKICYKPTHCESVKRNVSGKINLGPFGAVQIHITAVNTLGSATATFHLTKKDIAFIPPVPQNVKVVPDFSSQTLSLKWTSGVSALAFPTTIAFEIQVLWTEKMEVIHTESYAAQLDSQNKTFQWSWISGMPLNCTSHSVRIRSISTDSLVNSKNGSSDWSKLQTVPGADDSKSVMFPEDKVVRVGTNMTFCCVAGRGERIKTLVYGAEHLPCNELGIRRKAITKYNLPPSNPSGTNIMCELDPFDLIGTVVFVGYPPDDQQLECETRDLQNIVCYWNPGRQTMLLGGRRTFYTLTERISGKNASCHRANDADPNGDKHKCHFPVISGQQMYKFLLKAKNPLGEVETNYTLNLYTRVYPYSPSKVTVLCTGSRQTELFLSWEVSYKNMTCLCQFEIITNNKEKQLMNFTLPGQEANAHSTVAVDQLYPDTSYSFRTRCASAEHFWKWSSWSESKTCKTQEEAPSKALDVWREIKRTEHGQNVLVKWKPLPHSDAKGTIVKYEITWNDVNEVGEQSAVAPVSVNSTELHLNFSDYVISVRAVNSVGSSPSSQIRILGLLEEQADEPSIISGTPSGFNLSWSPGTNETCGYIVEWCLFPDTLDCNLQWEKVPPKTTHTVITSDGFRPGVRYSFSVYGCSQHKEYLLKKMVGYTQELAPRRAVKVKAEANSSHTVTLRWEDIPVQDRQGFIRGYRVYYVPQVNYSVRSQKSGIKEVINITDPDVRNVTVTNLHSTTYEFTVKAYTAGGEGIGEPININLVDSPLGLILAILVPLGVTCFCGILLAIFCYTKRNCVKETFYPDIPKPEIHGEQWSVGEGRSSNPTFDVKPFIPDKVRIIESLHGKDAEDSDICKVEINNGDSEQIDVNSCDTSTNPMLPSYYPQIVDSYKASSDSSSGSMNSCATQVTYSDIQPPSNGSVNNLEVISDCGYKPQMRPHVPLLDVNHTPNPQHLDLPEQSEGYQPQLKVSNWSLESPEVDEASACIGSPTSVNSTQFLLPDQASEEGQSTRSSSWKFSSFMSSAQKR